MNMCVCMRVRKRDNTREGNRQSDRESKSKRKVVYKNFKKENENQWQID